MIVFLRILMFVPWVLLVVFIVLAVVFAIQAMPKKNQAVEEKHKSAKKKSNIFATISVFTIILGIVISFALNNYILNLIAKEKVDSSLFYSSDNSNSASLSENQQKIEMLKKYRDKLNNGEALRANEIDTLNYLADDIAKQIISSTIAASNDVLNAYTSAAPNVGVDIDNSIIDSLSGLNKIVVEAVSESCQNVSDYLNDVRSGESVSSEITAECVKDIDCILAYAETILQ